MIRDARISDKEQLLTLWNLGYGKTPYANMEYDPIQVHRAFAACCTFDEKFFCKVSEVGGKVRGVLVGVIDQNFWGVPTASAMLSYSRCETATLLKEFVAWSQSRGAKQITVNTVSGNDRYREIVESLGFNESGRLYTMEL